MLKLFYVTDIHGSNVCYRKFLNALPIYGVDVAVLNGDLLGKVLIPLVEKPGGGRECHRGAQQDGRRFRHAAHRRGSFHSIHSALVMMRG